MFARVRRRKRALYRRPEQAPPPVLLAPPPSPEPREPALRAGRRARGGARSACAERLLLSRGRTPLSHLPDKHHENSAAHTVIAAPAAGRASTPPSRGARARARARSPSAPAPPRRQPSPTAAGRTPGWVGASGPRNVRAPPPRLHPPGLQAPGWACGAPGASGRGPAAVLTFGSGASAPPRPAPGGPVTASARGRGLPRSATLVCQGRASRGAPGPCAPPCRPRRPLLPVVLGSLPRWRIRLRSALCLHRGR